MAIDDEGTPGQYNVLIENGILKGYMQDKLNARLMGMTPTGNGRRESYAHLPMPRMTNTYMLPGKSTRKKLLNLLSTVSMHRTLVAVRWILHPANSFSPLQKRI